MSSREKRWVDHRLRFLAKVNPSRREVATLSPETVVSFVPMETVQEWGGISGAEMRPLAEIGGGYTYFRDGDVVVAKITPCFENGKGTLAQGLENGIAFGTTELHVLRPSEKLDGRFLFYITVSHEFRYGGEIMMYGAAGQKRVPEWFFRDYRVKLPNLAKQRAIADFLDRKTQAIDALIQKKERLIALLQEKRQALITQAVTKGINPTVPMKDSGIEWLGEIPAHWEIKRLRRIALGGTQNGLYKSKTFYCPVGTPIISMAEAFSDPTITETARERVNLTVDELSSYALRPGDLLFARRSLVFEGSGKCSIVGELPETHIFESSIIRVSPDTKQIIPQFLFRFLQSHFSRAQLLSVTKQVTISGIDGQQLKATTVLVPPIKEQVDILMEIDSVLGQVDRTEDVIRLQIEKLREYRQALISAAVTGKIDVTKETV